MITTVKLVSYTQRAKGQFETYLRPNSPHCGYKVADWPIRESFTYDIEIRAKQLDPNNFMLDNTWFQQYFGDFNFSQITVSCERLARLIAEDIIKAYSPREVELVRVTLSAVAGTSVMCEYSQENGTPCMQAAKQEEPQAEQEDKRPLAARLPHYVLTSMDT